jgi:hypothetical protein
VVASPDIGVYTYPSGAYQHALLPIKGSSIWFLCFSRRRVLNYRVIGVSSLFYYCEMMNCKTLLGHVCKVNIMMEMRRPNKMIFEY